MNKKMMVMPFLFLILMVVPMVDAREVNETVVDISDDVLVILDSPDDVIIIHNVTEPDLASIQLQLDNIYAGMMMHDTLIMNGRSSVRELNTTLNDTIVNFIGIVEDLGFKLLDSDAQLQGQIDTQNVYIGELGEEIYQLRQELVNERTRTNNITIMFGIFCLVVIGVTVVINKK